MLAFAACLLQQLRPGLAFRVALSSACFMLITSFWPGMLAPFCGLHRSVASIGHAALALAQGQLVWQVIAWQGFGNNFASCGHLPLHAVHLTLQSAQQMGRDVARWHAYIETIQAFCKG